MNYHRYLIGCSPPPDVEFVGFETENLQNKQMSPELRNILVDSRKDLVQHKKVISGDLSKPREALARDIYTVCNYIYIFYIYIYMSYHHIIII